MDSHILAVLAMSQWQQVCLHSTGRVEIGLNMLVIILGSGEHHEGMFVQGYSAAVCR